MKSRYSSTVLLPTQSSARKLLNTDEYQFPAISSSCFLLFGKLVCCLLEYFYFSISRVPFHFGEYGNYSLWVKNLNDSSVVSCSIVTLADPVNSYIRESHWHERVNKLLWHRETFWSCMGIIMCVSLHTAILVAFLIFTGLALVYTIGKTVLR